MSHIITKSETSKLRNNEFRITLQSEALSMEFRKQVCLANVSHSRFKKIIGFYE